MTGQNADLQNSNADPVLVAAELTKTYRGASKPALDGCSIEIKEGWSLGRVPTVTLAEQAFGEENKAQIVHDHIDLEYHDTAGQRPGQHLRHGRTEVPVSGQKNDRSRTPGHRPVPHPDSA